MTVQHTPDHPGTLIVESKDQITVTVSGVTRFNGQTALDALCARKSIVIPDASGFVYMIEAYSVIAARWEPSP